LLLPGATFDVDKLSPDGGWGHWADNSGWTCVVGYCDLEKSNVTDGPTPGNAGSDWNAAIDAAAKAILALKKLCASWFYTHVGIASGQASGCIAYLSIWYAPIATDPPQSERY
jgi:hypothetical protein